MNIAFYAPLKSPTHSSPSGDRMVGRLLLSALRTGGHQVHLASQLRSLDRYGDAKNQAQIRTRAGRISQRLIERYQQLRPHERPQLWFTYHLYHKAPDLIGPPVSRALGIPYVVAEASHAPKQAGGAWDAGYCCAARAMQHAALIICLNRADTPCVSQLLGNTKTLRTLAPFIDTRISALALRRRTRLCELLDKPIDAEVPIIACAAMMREGDKLASYQALAKALQQLVGRRWQLLILGDGAAREQVVAAMSPLGSRVLWAGQVEAQKLPQWLCACDLYAWPAVNEAWSMAIIEAAAVGLPCVAGDEGGVASVVNDGCSGILTPAGDSGAFAGAVATLLDNKQKRQRMGEAAHDKAFREHDLHNAAKQLNRYLDEVVA